MKFTAIFVLICLTVCSVNSKFLIRTTKLYSEHVSAPAVPDKIAYYHINFPNNKVSQVSEIVDFYRHDRTPYKSELMFAREGGVVDTMFSFNSPELNQALDTFFTITYTTDLDQPQNRPQSAFTYVKEAKVPAIRGEIVSHNLYFNNFMGKISDIEHNDLSMGLLTLRQSLLGGEGKPVRAYIVDGGIGFNHVNITITSDRSNGIDSTFRITYN